jgi:hypothetical protein
MEKLVKKLTLSPIEFVKFQLNQVINVPVKMLNDTDITVLAYVHVYGKQSKYKCLKEQVLTAENSFINYISKLRGMGYIQKSKPKGDPLAGVPMLNPDILILNEDFILMTVITKDPDNVKVYHPYHKPEDSREIPTSGV